MLTPEQILAARRLLNWTRNELAEHARTSPRRIQYAEAFQEGPEAARVHDRMQSAFEAHGVEFTNGGQPGARMKAERK
jgi:hypothetical protein